MAIFNASVLIKELRKAKGWTQAQLAEGICSAQTIYLIEGGKNKPYWYTFSAIMTKLGIDPELYYNDVASDEDVFIENKYRECDKLTTAWDYEALKIEVDKMEQDKRFAKGHGYFVYIRVKTGLYLQGPYQDSQLALEYLHKQIKLLRPDFELGKIPDYYLARDEISILNDMAISYHHLEGAEKALEIFYMIQAVFDRDYKKNVRNEVIDRHYHANLHNICLTCKHAGRYEECIAIADKGMALYKGDRDTLQQAWYMYFKAFYLMKQGNKQEGELLYKKFLLYTFVFDGYCVDSTWHKEEFEKEFGYKLDLSVAW